MARKRRFKNPYDHKDSIWYNEEKEKWYGGNPWENDPGTAESIIGGSSSESSRREVYLTFDDGLQLGTYESLLALKKAGVRGTYFLTGIHIKYFFEEYGENLGIKLLRNIYQNHDIGNHSYSHANDFYSNFYTQGLKIGVLPSGGFAFRQVVEDFEKNNKIIVEYLKRAGLQVPDNKKFLNARFPGRNSWIFPGVEDLRPDTKEEAKELSKLGYNIWGWDSEWKMSFDFAGEARSMVNSALNSSTLNWSDERQTHPFFEMDSTVNIHKDRLIESWESEFDDIMDKLDPGIFESNPKNKGKVVVLMHERSFRTDENGRNNSAIKLWRLIEELKKENVSFKTISEYL